MSDTDLILQLLGDLTTAFLDYSEKGSLKHTDKAVIERLKRFSELATASGKAMEGEAERPRARIIKGV